MLRKVGFRHLDQSQTCIKNLLAQSLIQPTPIPHADAFVPRGEPLSSRESSDQADGWRVYKFDASELQIKKQRTCPGY